MTLNDSLMSRLDRLGSAKSVAEIGAVIGREFSYELLAKVADLPEEHLREELYRLVDAGLLVSRRSTAVLSYAFKHALVRDAAYESVLRSARRGIHARIGAALEVEASATRERDRLNGLYGAARAAELSGNTAKAKALYTELVTLCARADGDRPELKRAKAALGK